MRLAVRQREEDLARARRQEPEHRLRRRGPREVRPRVAVLASSTTPARTAAPGAGSSSSARPTTGSSSCSPRRPGPSRSATRPTRRPRSARWSASSSATASRTTSRSAWARARRSSSAATRPTIPPWPTAPTSCRRSSTASTNDMRIAREEIFGPVVVDHPVRHRGGGAPPRQRHAVRAVGLDLEPRHRQGAARGQGAPGRRHQRQLELVGPHRGAVRRLQDVGHRARARDVARSTSTPRPRTSSSTSR